MMNLVLSRAGFVIPCVLVVCLSGSVSCNEDPHRSAVRRDAEGRPWAEQLDVLPRDQNEEARNSSGESLLDEELAAHLKRVASKANIPLLERLRQRQQYTGRALTSVHNASNNSSPSWVHIDFNDIFACSDLDWTSIYGSRCEDFVLSGNCGASWQIYDADHNGVIADQACCGCGGGVAEYLHCKDMDWVDRGGDTCADYAREGWCSATWQLDWADENGTTGDEACCACGGGTCRDHSSWASTCPMWRSSGLCANNSYGAAWDFEANGTFDQHIIDGMTVNSGCCGCGRHFLLPGMGLSAYLAPHQETASQVGSIIFADAGLEGRIPEDFHIFTNLAALDLSGNPQLTGTLPDTLGLLTNLQVLDLSRTALEGVLPTGLGGMTSLQRLQLRDTMIGGTIPASMENLTKLEYWYQNNGQLSGSIPGGVAGMAALIDLNLNNQPRLAGTLPSGVGGLTNLQVLDVSWTGLEGQIPDAIHTWSSLMHLELSHTAFAGAIPDAIGSFTALTHWGYANIDFSGQIPDGIGALSGLDELDFSGVSKFAGTLPSAISQCTNLVRLKLTGAALSGTLPVSLGDMSRLQRLHLRDTKIGGTIPDSIESLTNLEYWYQDNGQLTGSIPGGLAGMTALLDLFFNNQPDLEGPMPDGIGNCTRLKFLGLAGTGLAGTLPDALGALSGMDYMYLSDTRISGSLKDVIVSSMRRMRALAIGNTGLAGTLPDALGYLQSMQHLLLGNTKNTGTIPAAPWSSMRWLRELDLSNTPFEGSIPEAMGALSYLQSLRIHGARLSGNLSEALTSGLQSLQDLSLQDNRLTGTIPSSWGSSLSILDLRRNALRGSVPRLGTRVAELLLGGNKITGSLPNIHWHYNDLRIYDLSDNQLEGVPQVDHFPPTLRELYLDGNDGLGGLLPDIAFCTNLQIIEAGGCSFTAVSLLPYSLARLNLSGNELSELPTGISNLNFLEFVDFSNNKIASIDATPPPLLLEANFDNNAGLRFIHRAWLNEQQQFRLQHVSLLNNSQLRIDIRAPALCQAGASALVSADPNSYETSSQDDSYECTVPCRPAGLRELGTEPGVLDPGALCRCRPGFGLLPGMCWDQNFRMWGNSSSTISASETGNPLFQTCPDISIGNQSASNSCSPSGIEQADVLKASCCRCGGEGGGGNGLECFECPKNTYAFSEPWDAFKWRSICRACPEGATSNGPRQASRCGCSCPRGSYLSTGYICQEDEWLTAQRSSRDEQRAEECIPCSFLRTTAGPGAMGPLRCVCRVDGEVDSADVVPELVDNFGQCGCPENYYFNSVQVSCKKCAAQGESCHWGFDISRSLRPPFLQPGYWAATSMLINEQVIDIESNASVNGTIPFDGHRIYKCFSDDTCQGSTGACAAGRHGVACSLCLPDHFGGPNGTCQRCQGSVILAMWLASITIPFIVLLAHILSSSSEMQTRGLLMTLKAFRVSGRQFIKHMQIVGVVSGFSIGWPLDVKAAFEAVQVFSFRIADVSATACLADEQTATLELTFRWCLPIVFAVVGTLTTPFLAACIRRLILLTHFSRRIRGFSKRLCMTMKDAVKAVYWCLLLAFPTLISFGFSLLACRHNPNDEYTVLIFPHLHCPGSRSGTDEEWFRLLPVGILYLLLCFVLILGFYFYAWVRTVTHLECSAYEGRGAHQFLFEDFRNTALHWPLLLLARDVVINVVQSLLINMGTAQLLCTAFFSLMLGYLCAKQKPYNDFSNNVLEVSNALSVFTVCVFTAGLGFAQEPSIDTVASMVKGTDGEESMRVRALVLLGFQLVSMLGPFLIVGYQLLILIPCVERRLPPDWRALREEEEQHIREVLLLDLLGEHVADVAEMTELMRFLHRLDSHELRFLADFCHSRPAAVGILRGPGGAAGVSEIIKRKGSAQTPASPQTSERGGGGGEGLSPRPATAASSSAAASNQAEVANRWGRAEEELRADLEELFQKCTRGGVGKKEACETLQQQLAALQAKVMLQLATTEGVQEVQQGPEAMSTSSGADAIVSV